MPTANPTHAATGEPIEKFAFGRNWSNFLDAVDDDAIESAVESLRKLLQCDSLQSKRFLDAGSGSGLFSLAAHRLGADVISFDADAESVACTNELRRRSDDPSTWFVRQGSLLDRDFLDSFEAADVVYCWGVAHHTGDMWRALDHLTSLVTPDGRLVVAIYNDEGYISKLWVAIKQIYQKLPGWLQPVYVLGIGTFLFLKRLMITLAASLLRLITFRNPFVPFMNWFRETRDRGMRKWFDLVDWVGGWPFQVARPEEIFRFFRDRGFVLTEMTTSGGHGCNEFAFRREPNDSAP